MSTISDIHALKASFTPVVDKDEPQHFQELISRLGLIPHIEGGYFVETDRAPDLVPSPFPPMEESTLALVPQRPGFRSDVRNSSTTIFYLLTPNSPQGGFHRNKGRTVHTLHKGRGRYVIIHADEEGKEKRIETFLVGQNIAAGERLQWIVEGDKYKASYLLPDTDDSGESSSGLLISETVIPGFEFCDHDFLKAGALKGLVGDETGRKLEWLLSPLGRLG
ncbi:RmlC-like cupin domain-containing protein [Xylogone sp. PMI_703]|nr:RmlC-like cupin domain-containing protein [Xylogone sp. PMI_703]